MVDYSKIWKHLGAYRQKQNMSKEEMAKMFGVTASHYGKLEAGIVKITFEKLQFFATHGGDIYYIFTGFEKESGPVETYMSYCKTRAGRIKLLHLLTAFIELGLWLDESTQTKVLLDEMPPTIYRSIRLMELERSDLTLWERIRDIEVLTQIEMAQLLGIDVKYYRQIEKEETLPTAEVIYALFCQLNYSPQLFFDREKFYLDELNHYWNRVSEKNQIYIGTMVDSMIHRIAERETR